MPPAKKVQPRCKHRKCLRPQQTKGFCKAHYGHLQKYGSTFDLLPPRTRKSPALLTETCAVPGCLDLSTQRTILCRRHGRQDYTYRRTFGITLLERLASETLVEGCEICGAQPGKLHLDHDHQTGKHRGYLCGPCNRGIGLMKDNPAVLRAAADYLERQGL